MKHTMFHSTFTLFWVVETQKIESDNNCCEVLVAWVVCHHHRRRRIVVAALTTKELSSPESELIGLCVVLPPSDRSR